MAIAVSRRWPCRCRNCRRSPGVRLGAAAAGIRYQGRTDLVMIELAAGSDGRRRVHLQQVPRRAGRLVPCRACRRARRAAWW